MVFAPLNRYCFVGSGSLGDGLKARLRSMITPKQKLEADVPLIFRHDDFYGRLQVRRTLPGFTLAHRIAEGPADSVETHTHVEAHFVLVTSGEYVSSARGINPLRTRAT